MAEIRVQPKKKSYWWIWVIILIIVVGVLYYLYDTNQLPGPNRDGVDSTQVIQKTKSKTEMQVATLYNSVFPNVV